MNEIRTNRRQALSAAAIAAATTRARPAVARDIPPLPDGACVLFQGDSITDAGRDRGAEDRPNHAFALGNGYARFVSAWLLSEHPRLGLRCLNRGISGNKVPDLDKRWQEDCLDLKPALVSILIGVNDIWHARNGHYDGTVETYERGLIELLERTRDALEGVRLVVCEPFALRCGAVKDDWFPEFDERRAAARRCADQVGATWVPFHERFERAVAEGSDPAYWAGDGVHPSLGGHMLMARAWLQATDL